MRPKNMQNATSNTRLLFALVVVAVTLGLAPGAFAAAPGITGTGATAGTPCASQTGPCFNLTAQDAYLNQPDGEAVYSWGFGCVAGSTPTFVPKAAFAFPPTCNTMQVPGPTMVVTEGQTVTVALTNNLPTAAGNTSILFPGFNVSTSCTATTPAGQQGLLTCEAAPGATVSYTFTASAPGTHPYYSGTQGDLQIEMGLYGAVIVLPSSPPSTCANGATHLSNLYGKPDYGTTTGIAGFPEQDFRLSTAAYDHPKSCYDREYLFQWAEMDPRIHKQAYAQVQAKMGCVAGANGCSLDVQTEPYHPAYFLINGRSMPDLMDPNYASEYPHQPYNGNPHMHPGELTLIRTIGQGRWQHPFHEHANHVRILARDGNLILSPGNAASPNGGPTQSLAGILMFNTDTTPGESFDGIFYFTGRGLNWDPYGHHPAGTNNTISTPFTVTALTETTNPAIGANPPTGTVTATVSGTLPSVFATNSYVTIAGATSGPFTITNISETGNTVTATVSGVFPSQATTVTIAGVAPAGFNGTFALASSTPGSTTTFTYTDSTSGLGSGTVGTASTATVDNPAYNGRFVATSVTPGTTTTCATAPCTTFTYTDATANLVPATAGTATVNLGSATNSFATDTQASLPCNPDANGYNTQNTAALNYYEWCQDHNKPVQVAPFGDVASGGPATLPDPNVFTNGAWYGGSPYLGPDASLRGHMPACDTTNNANCTNLQPSNVQANPANERGWAFMWHSHNEREITTNNVFPGGMLMMMLVDSREFAIDESN